VLSWIGHVGFVLGFYCCARTLWDDLPGKPLPTLAQHFLLVPLGLVISAVPLFPGGAGIGEVGFGWLYKVFGSDSSFGVLGSLVQRVVGWVIGLLGYGACMGMRTGASSSNPASTADGSPETSDLSQAKTAEAAETAAA
jgi:hypothetical protein